MSSMNRYALARLRNAAALESRPVAGRPHSRRDGAHDLGSGRARERGRADPRRQDRNRRYRARGAGRRNDARRQRSRTHTGAVRRSVGDRHRGDHARTDDRRCESAAECATVRNGVPSGIRRNGGLQPAIRARAGGAHRGPDLDRARAGQHARREFPRRSGRRRRARRALRRRHRRHPLVVHQSWRRHEPAVVRKSRRAMDAARTGDPRSTLARASGGQGLAASAGPRGARPISRTAAA